MKTLNTKQYKIYIGNNSIAKLNRFLSIKKYSTRFILVDENTKKHCLKKILTVNPSLSIIQIKGGEINKNICTCEKIWKQLSKQNADRKSLLINLGGGIITDIGGFAASIYKRGIDFINISTTLLAQVDASIGGKTGIDFIGYKNQIGTFAFPKAVFIIPDFLKTLSKRELFSGFAEVIKHALVADKKYWAVVKNSNSLSKKNWEELIFHSAQIKNKIVFQDPFENGLRKTLNFGHTIGHAVESASLKTKKPLLHGEAVATGIICEAYISHKFCGLSNIEFNEIISFVASIFQPKKINYSVKDLIALMRQDKKNRDAEINFTLLRAIGNAKINNSCPEELIKESISFHNLFVNQNQKLLRMKLDSKILSIKK